MYLGPIAMQQPCRGCGGRGQVITDPCPTCRGAGRVEAEEGVSVVIPCGADTGTVLDPIVGHGHEGPAGTPRGNLLLVTRVRGHRAFKRNGHNLECRHPISFARAALGGPIEVTTLVGEKVTVEVPRGTQTDTVLRARGHGMPDLGDPRQRGDLLVQVVVETPTALSPEQEQLLRRLAELEGFTPPPPPKSIFGKLKDLITGETPQTDQTK
jgi:molecular chaperone DnaJ